MGLSREDLQQRFGPDVEACQIALASLREGAPVFLMSELTRGAAESSAVSFVEVPQSVSWSWEVDPLEIEEVLLSGDRIGAGAFGEGIFPSGERVLLTSVRPGSLQRSVAPTNRSRKSVAARRRRSRATFL